MPNVRQEGTCAAFEQISGEDLVAHHRDAIDHLLGAHPGELAADIRSTGFFNNKAKSLIGAAKKITGEFKGEVPRTLEELMTVPGAARKTANVVLGTAYGIASGIVVDTHVQRLSQRLGLTRHTEPPEIEQDLMLLYPRERWDMLSHLLIFHGRRVCTAQKPACAACPLNKICPSAFHAENVGRKPARVRTRG